MDEERLDGASNSCDGLNEEYTATLYSVRIVSKLIVAYYWDNKCINLFPTADQLMIIAPAYCIVHLSVCDSTQRTIIGLGPLIAMTLIVRVVSWSIMLPRHNEF